MDVIIPIVAFLLVAIAIVGGLVFLVGRLFGISGKAIKRDLSWSVNYVNGKWTSPLDIVFEGIYKYKKVKCGFSKIGGGGKSIPIIYAAIKLRYTTRKFLIDYPKPSEDTVIRQDWLCHEEAYVPLSKDYRNFFSKEQFPSILEKLYNTAEIVDRNPRKWDLVKGE